MNYEQTIAWGADQYRDVLDALQIDGLRAEFTQTGGMCAAIIIPLDGGYYLLLTDREDTLAWDRPEHDGWWVGLYEPEERRTTDHVMRWLDDGDGSPAKAVDLVHRVLRGETAD